MPTKKIYQERREQGLCPLCGGERETTAYIMCEACRDKANTASKKCYSKKKERNRAYMAARAQRRREQGLCPVCGKEREDTAYIMCAACRERIRLSQQRIRLARKGIVR